MEQSADVADGRLQLVRFETAGVDADAQPATAAVMA
jgi:hypothetical protein